MRYPVSKRWTVWNVEGPLEECFRAEGMWLDALKEWVADWQEAILYVGRQMGKCRQHRSSWGAGMKQPLPPSRGLTTLTFVVGSDYASQW